jgi:hypothetical protein
MGVKSCSLILRKEYKLMVFKKGDEGLKRRR